MKLNGPLIIFMDNLKMVSLSSSKFFLKAKPVDLYSTFTICWNLSLRYPKNFMAIQKVLQLIQWFQRFLTDFHCYDLKKSPFFSIKAS